MAENPPPATDAAEQAAMDALGRVVRQLAEPSRPTSQDTLTARAVRLIRAEREADLPLDDTGQLLIAADAATRLLGAAADAVGVRASCRATRAPTGARVAISAAVALDRPLPEVAADIRGAVGTAAELLLGLPLAAIDISFDSVLPHAAAAPASAGPAADASPQAAEAGPAASRSDYTPPPPAAEGRPAGPDAAATAAPPSQAPDAAMAARAVSATPGVAGLHPTLLDRLAELTGTVLDTGRVTGVHVEESAMTISVTVVEGHRARDVAQAARAAAQQAVADSTVTIRVADFAAPA